VQRRRCQLAQAPLAMLVVLMAPAAHSLFF
jgi:hypothetical protein